MALSGVSPWFRFHARTVFEDEIGRADVVLTAEDRHDVDITASGGL